MRNILKDKFMRDRFASNFFISLGLYAIVSFVSVILVFPLGVGGPEMIRIWFVIIWLTFWSVVLYMFLAYKFLSYLDNFILNYLSVSSTTILLIAVIEYTIMQPSRFSVSTNIFFAFISFAAWVRPAVEAMGPRGLYILAVLPSVFIWIGVSIKQKITAPKGKYHCSAETLNQWQKELVESSEFIGKTLADLEKIFGDLTVGEIEKDLKPFTANSTKLTFLFGDKGKCVAISGPLNSLIPSLNEPMTLAELNEMLDSDVFAYKITKEESEFKGYYGIYGYVKFVPLYMRTNFAKEADKEPDNEVWKDAIALKLFDNVPIENPDEIKPEYSFTISIAKETSKWWQDKRQLF